MPAKAGIQHAVPRLLKSKRFGLLDHPPSRMMTFVVAEGPSPASLV
jgi:hypothetical protein